MTQQFAGDGLAGLTGPLDGNDDDESQQEQLSPILRDADSPHYHFLHSMLIPSTIKIQKELRVYPFFITHVFFFFFFFVLHSFWPDVGCTSKVE
eukprot:scaffold318_cov110-Cylindrotheca_fusiformis.AAC.8